MYARVQSLLASESPAVEVAELQKLVLKIFWSATYMGIPALLLQEPQFVGWMTSLLQAVKQPVPQVRPWFTRCSPSPLQWILPASRADSSSR